MPPETPLTKHEVPPDQVLSFFEVDQASKALKDVDFTIHEELRTLVQLFRDPDPQVSLRAHTQLRKVLKEVADASGLIEKQEVTAVNQETGNSVKLTRTASRVASALPEKRLNEIYDQKPTFAAEYLPSEEDGDREGSDVDEANGSDEPREIRRTDPI